MYSLKFKLCLLDPYTASLSCTRNITEVFQGFCQPGRHNSELEPSGTRSLRPLRLGTAPHCSSESRHQVNESSTQQLSSEHVGVSYLCHLADAPGDQFLPLLLCNEELQLMDEQNFVEKHTGHGLKEKGERRT